MNWARHPTGFALAITGLTVTGLALMLTEGPTWKVAGFLLAASPLAAGLAAYWVQRRRG